MDSLGTSAMLSFYNKYGYVWVGLGLNNINIFAPFISKFVLTL
jgi:hypothetical protein